MNILKLSRLIEPRLPIEISTDWSPLNRCKTCRTPIQETASTAISTTTPTKTTARPRTPRASNTTISTSISTVKLTMPPREAASSKATIGTSVNTTTTSSLSFLTFPSTSGTSATAISSSANPAKWFRFTYGPNRYPPYLMTRNQYHFPLNVKCCSIPKMDTKKLSPIKNQMKPRQWLDR